MTKIRHDPDPRPLRAAAYPSIGDQLDAVMQLADFLLHDGNELPPKVVEWINNCKAVKAKVPKRS